MQGKLVSILISTYNAEKYIEEAIESALAQTYKNIEIVIIDAGSKDRTAQIVKSFEDKRIRYIKHDFEPIHSTRNALFKEAKGEFLTFLDSDDIYLPRKVEAEVNFLENHPDYAAVYCDLRYFFDGKPGALYKHKYDFHSGDIFKELLDKMFITNTTFMMRRAVHEAIGGYSEILGMVEDWDYFLRMAHRGFKFGFIGEPLVRYRLRWDSHTNFKNQVPIQESAVKIFENLKRVMTAQERELYNIDLHIAHRKEKLAIALLAQGRKKDARKILREVKKWIPVGRMFLLSVILPVPAALLRKIIEMAWKRKRKKLFIQV